MKEATDFIKAMVDFKVAVHTRNYDQIPALIERVQVLGNRMEAALDDQKEFHEIMDKRNEAKDYLRKLEKQIKDAEKKAEDLGLGSNED